MGRRRRTRTSWSNVQSYENVHRRHSQRQKEPDNGRATTSGRYRSFTQLQKDRERADYDSGWLLVETDVRDALQSAEDIFENWKKVRHEGIARSHLLTMFGARVG